jgi:hypothetical protein
MRIDYETVKLVNAIRKMANSIPLDQIDIYKNGKKVKVTKSSVDHFEMTGLNNWDYLSSPNMWKQVVK